jgi:hypothetical protein
MQLPQWAIHLALPAQRYARRRQQAYINERRRQHPLAQPTRISENEARPPAADDESFQARTHKIRDHRLARISSIAAEQDELLHATAEDLERTGTTEISTAEGNIAARLIRFRWGPDSLDITRTREGHPAGWSLSTVPRSPASARTAAITSALAQALAALDPLPPT